MIIINKKYFKLSFSSYKLYKLDILFLWQLLNKNTLNYRFLPINYLYLGLIDLNDHLMNLNTIILIFITRFTEWSIINFFFNFLFQIKFENFVSYFSFIIHFPLIHLF